jgi:hypothetical protein
MDEEAIQSDVMTLKYKTHMTNTITLNTPALCTTEPAVLHSQNSVLKV